MVTPPTGSVPSVVVLGVAVTRIAAAFVLTPFLGPDVVPTLVRICIMVSMAAWILSLTGWQALGALDAQHLAAAMARETLIGTLIGFVFSGVLWAFLIAGQLIDQKIGGAQAAETDPAFGGQSSTYGLLISRFALAVFAVCGGLSVFVQTLTESYVLWPLNGPGATLDPASAQTLAGLFQTLMASALMIVAPALVILTLGEGALGLINRAAPRLNAFALSLSLKGWLAALIVLLMAGRLTYDLEVRASQAEQGTIAVLRQLLR